MNAFINEIGTLYILPTTDLEVYALKQWRNKYDKVDEKSGMSTHLTVNGTLIVEVSTSLES